jgi:hypothetical protein
MRSSFSIARVFAVTQALLLLTCVHGWAQDSSQPGRSPAHLAYVDGAATLEREGQTETAVSGMPFVPGDRLVTTRGRIDVLFTEGTSLAIDEYTTIELQDRALLRMMAGRALLTVVGVNDPGNAVRYQIDTPSASATTDGPGEYRVALMNGRGELETELAVFRGFATLATDVGSTEVRAGERTLARDNLAPSQPLLFNSARFDAFDRWASARREARLGTTSTQYLPRDLYAYSSTFDAHGTWGYQAPYGNVWYPTVAPGWRPYYYGYWSPVPRYGWTWIGHDAWGWPTHHYGHWGFAGRWYWVPGATWGSAWVSWASAPGYVGWCPIGYCGAGFSFGVSFGNPWGWVVVSRPYFGYKYPAHHHALPPAAIPYRTPFVVQARAPLAPPVAVPRQRAVPRAPAGGPVVSQGARSAAARSASGRQPTTVPGVAPAIAPNQPELGTGRATLRSQAAPATSAPAAGARTRSSFAAPPATNDQPGVNRYVPDTRTLGGRPASAVPRRAAPASPTPNESAIASPRWYPPVTMTRPRTEQQPSVAPQPSPGYRAAPRERAQPFIAAPSVPSRTPGFAQPRRPTGAPAVSAFQAPQVSSPAARGTFGGPPASTNMPRGPVAVPRAAPQGPASAQPAPAQPAPPPAGARSPRSR